MHSPLVLAFILVPFIAQAPAAAGPAAGELSATAIRLVRAYRAHDETEMRSAARRLGARGLEPLLDSSNPAVCRAAMAAAPWADDGWRLLFALAQLGDHRDRQLAIPAAIAASLIAQELTALTIQSEEISLEALAKPATRWHKTSLRSGKWSDVRVRALEVAVLLSSLHPSHASPNSRIDLFSLSADSDPEIRRAALELLPTPLDATAQVHVGERMRVDDDAVVAVVAGQVLCGGIATGDPAKPLLEAADDQGLARLRTLIVHPALPALARVEASLCLRAAGGSANRKAIAAMRKSIPPGQTRKRSMSKAKKR